MRAERLGSYSMVATRAGTPSLSRLKSMRRYRRLCPPPRWRVVMRPWLLRPAFDLRGRRSGLCGSVVVMSSNATTEMPRRPGEVGLYLLIAIVLHRPEEIFDALPTGERHDGLLPGGRIAAACPGALFFRPHGHRVDGSNVDPKALLDRLLDLRLGGLARHAEGIAMHVRIGHLRLARRRQLRALLRNERPFQNSVQVHNSLPLQPSAVSYQPSAFPRRQCCCYHRPRC